MKFLYIKDNKLYHLFESVVMVFWPYDCSNTYAMTYSYMKVSDCLMKTG